MLAPGRSLQFVTLPQGQDPDDLIRAKGVGAIEALLAEALTEITEDEDEEVEEYEEYEEDEVE